MKRRQLPIFLSLLLLLLWYVAGLFGVPGLINPTFGTGQSAYNLAAGGLGIFLLLGLVGYWLELKYIDLIMVNVLMIWLYLQFMLHWLGFFRPPAPDVVSAYYDYYGGSYLIPQDLSRTVPNAYFLLLHLLLIVTFGQVLFRLVHRFRFRKQA